MSHAQSKPGCAGHSFPPLGHYSGGRRRQAPASPHSADHGSRPAEAVLRAHWRQNLVGSNAAAGIPLGRSSTDSPGADADS